MREIAMTVGAQAVTDVLVAEARRSRVATVTSIEEVRRQMSAADTERILQASAIAEAKHRLESMEEALAESMRYQRLSCEKHRELLGQIAAIQDTHSAEIFRVREELSAKLETERLRIRTELAASVGAEIAEKAKREADESHRDALLQLRERYSAERDELTTRLDERHSAAVARLEQRHTTESAVLARSLEQLRTEHEGLVVKLMSRLEGNGRGGSGSTTSAAALGRTFEENVERHLRQAFGARSGFRLEDVHAIGHSGDLMMVFDGLRILVELKSYDPKTRVPTKEVEKLARDLAEVQPRCDAAIMISAASEITGHYQCGPLEVSSTVACVPVLFINSFLSLGEPQVTLHMTRVFLSMVGMVSASIQRAEIAENDATPGHRDATIVEKTERAQRANVECARRCTGYLAELSRQSTDLLRQVTTMKTGAMKLRESVIALVESEVTRFNGIVQLMSIGSGSVISQSQTPMGSASASASASADIAEQPLPSVVIPNLDCNVFTPPESMSVENRRLAVSISESFDIGDLKRRCVTKDLVQFALKELKTSSDKVARDALKAICKDTVIKHGFFLGISQRTVALVDKNIASVTTVPIVTAIPKPLALTPKEATARVAQSEVVVPQLPSHIFSEITPLVITPSPPVSSEVLSTVSQPTAVIPLAIVTVAPPQTLDERSDYSDIAYETWSHRVDCSSEL